MIKSTHPVVSPNNKSVLKNLKSYLIIAMCFCMSAVLFRPSDAYAQMPVNQETGTPFRIGEKLTYTVAFERYNNVAYAELKTVSRGKIGDMDAIELRSRIKTLDFVSAAFYLIDESRTIFASPELGLPIYISKNRNIGGLPKETIQNYLTVPASNYDLVTLIYKIRNSGGSGAMTIQENEKIYAITFQTTGNEKIKTDGGEFDTSIITVQSEYLTDNGLKDLRINLSSDDAKIPVLIRFKNAKGEFKASVASIQNIEPQAEVLPTPSPIATPRPTPAPAATPRPYVENQPLAADLSFELGESLEYAITTVGQPVGTFTLQAKERKELLGQDSLLLTATVTGVQQGNRLFSLNDYIRAQVNPETLGPRQIQINFNGTFNSLNLTAQFDEKTSVITFNGAGQVEAPVGTHSLLSLIYAVRSFNLKPSKDTYNPINDTRVAVFWENKPYIFTLRPSTAEIIDIKGMKISAQLISVNTGNPQLDSLNIKVWLSNDSRRLPLRFSAGQYQADLISEKNLLLK